MNIPSIESLLSELDKYKRAYESCDAQILSLKEQRNRLTAERDEWEANSGQWEQEYYKASAERDAALAENAAYYQLAKKEVWAIAESALREAKEALKAKSYLGDMQAIATINKVLGEE